MDTINSTLYFAYGSNMWLNQMARRCPGNTYIGIGVLKDWKWLINRSGYANVVPSPDDIVYGLVYTLTPSDEATLDTYEGVPNAYVKQAHSIELTKEGQQEKRLVDCLVYVDVVRLEPGHPKTEYIPRMNAALRDAEERGVPKDYVEKYVRHFIPLLQN